MGVDFGKFLCRSLVGAGIIVRVDDPRSLCFLKKQL